MAVKNAATASTLGTTAMIPSKASAISPTGVNVNTEKEAKNVLVYCENSFYLPDP